MTDGVPPRVQADALRAAVESTAAGRVPGRPGQRSRGRRLLPGGLRAGAGRRRPTGRAGAAYAARRALDPEPGRASTTRPGASNARSATCTASRPIGHPLPARLVRHGHWPRGWYPMRRDAGPPPPFEPDVGSFPFLEVEGRGRLRDPGRARPCRSHRARTLPLLRRGRDHPADEGPAVVRPPRRREALRRASAGRRDRARRAHQRRHRRRAQHSPTRWRWRPPPDIEVDEQDRLVRALLLELERMHNHVADLGALANDVGYGIVNAHASRLRETLLRLNKADDRPPAAARRDHHRRSPPGLAPRPRHRGVRRRGGGRAGRADPRQLDRARPVHRHRASSAGTQPLELGTLGYVARASGVDIDARRDHPFVDLGDRFSVVVEPAGDVLARYLVRVREFDDLGASRDGPGSAARRHAPGKVGRSTRIRPVAGSAWSRAGEGRSPTGSSSTGPGR